MTTQELVGRSFFNADDLSLLIMEHPDAPQFLAVKIADEHDAEMARRLSEMDAENKRLREALTEADNCPHWQCMTCRPKIRAALEHDKGEPK